MREPTNAVIDLQRIQRHLNRYCIWQVSLPSYSHHQAFDEVASSLSDAFSRLGGSAPIVHDPHGWGGRIPIVIGAHLIPFSTQPVKLPQGSVLFNTEQIGAAWSKEPYLDLLRKCLVWDYSTANIERLVEVGVRQPIHFRLGFSSVMRRIPVGVIKDIDFLFYGSLNQRRAIILKELRSQGFKVVHLFDKYGAARDKLISRAKVVLNIHFYETQVFESIRVTYLLANEVCVVSEGAASDPDLPVPGDGLVVVPYDRLVDTCAALISDERSMRTIARCGFEMFSTQDQAGYLIDALRAFGDER